ncbi:YfiR family protein [Thiolapillus sp.]
MRQHPLIMRAYRWRRPWSGSNRYLFALFLGIGISITVSQPAQADPPSMVEVRALYLYNFAIFVRWPDNAFKASDSPLRYCILGNRKLRRTLARVLKGEAVKGHPLELQATDALADWTQCHLLYLDASLAERIQGILTTLGSQPVLTVSNSRDFPANGGMIGLVRKGRRIHPVINTGVTTNVGIRISSKLLRLSTVIANDSEKAAP